MSELALRLEAFDVGQHIVTAEVVAPDTLEDVVGPRGVDGLECATFDEPMHGASADFKQFGYFFGGHYLSLSLLRQTFIPLCLYTDIRNILPQVAPELNVARGIACKPLAVVQWDKETDKHWNIQEQP